MGDSYLHDMLSFILMTNDDLDGFWKIYYFFQCRFCGTTAAIWQLIITYIVIACTFAWIRVIRLKISRANYFTIYFLPTK